MRPEPSEYAEFYARYIEKLEGDDILDILKAQLESSMQMFKTIDDAKGNFRYEITKWTVKELIGHVIDTERVFAYRGLAFGRGETKPQPGFDQDVWAEHAPYRDLQMSDITAEFDAVRRSSIQLYRHLDEAAMMRRGIGNNKEMTTRATAWVIAGHTQHHWRILESRYL